MQSEQNAGCQFDASWVERVLKEKQGSVVYSRGDH